MDIDELFGVFNEAPKKASKKSEAKVGSMGGGCVRGIHRIIIKIFAITNC